ncbi:hypothetical protein L2E82_35398 [Cichorium intybus]|uniref:Uncharacterized protein n=1 Tax=Cichorium intybus TaxID=13427 RepID=A0ACB9BNT4_CICIN|nr:hypothetical protein L2E82_35398 [Cichorium intybus]
MHDLAISDRGLELLPSGATKAGRTSSRDATMQRLKAEPVNAYAQFLSSQQPAHNRLGGSPSGNSIYSPEPGGVGNSRAWFTYEELSEATNGFYASEVVDGLKYLHNLHEYKQKCGCVLRASMVSRKENGKLHSASTDPLLKIPLLRASKCITKVAHPLSKTLLCFIFVVVRNFGNLIITVIEKRTKNVHHSFLDYLAGGCELNFMVAIDFTGPTLFGPIITVAANIANQSMATNEHKYFVLLIITAGVIKDLEETKDAIVQASDLPL